MPLCFGALCDYKTVKPKCGLSKEQMSNIIVSNFKTLENKAAKRKLKCVSKYELTKIKK